MVPPRRALLGWHEPDLSGSDGGIERVDPRVGARVNPVEGTDGYGTLLSSITPQGCESVEAWGFAPEDVLLAGELDAVRNATPKRRQEFTAGRFCARGALQKFGVPPLPIPQGLYREPLWPTGFVGSITHSFGYAAAVVARKTTLQSVGIDVEPREDLPTGVLDLIATTRDRRHMESLPRRMCWDRLLFSVKESVFKAWFPLTHCWLDFDDVHVTFGWDIDSFTANIEPRSIRISAGCPSVIHGRYNTSCRYVCSVASCDR